LESWFCACLVCNPPVCFSPLTIPTHALLAVSYVTATKTKGMVASTRLMWWYRGKFQTCGGAGTEVWVPDSMGPTLGTADSLSAAKIAALAPMSLLSAVQHTSAGVSPSCSTQHGGWCKRRTPLPARMPALGGSMQLLVVDGEHAARVLGSRTVCRVWPRQHQGVGLCPRRRFSVLLPTSPMPQPDQRQLSAAAHAPPASLTNAAHTCCAHPW
jgi:hypothetical protein